MNSLYGLNDKQLTSAVWASTAWLGLEVLFERVSQLRWKITDIIPWTVQDHITFQMKCYICQSDLTYYQASYIMSFWSSATDPKSDSWSKCQETSSTTAVWPVKIVFASTIFPSLGTALMSHRQTVYRLRRMRDKKHINISAPLLNSMKCMNEWLGICATKVGDPMKFPKIGKMLHNTWIQQ